MRGAAREQRQYREHARALQSAAARAQVREALEALVLEVQQFHQHYHRDCTSGCPAHEALAKGKAALPLVK